MTDASGTKDGSVRSLDRALRLLEVLGGSPDGQRLTDLATQAGLATSTTHRLLTTLEHRGFAQFNRGSGRWHVGGKAYAVGAAFLHRRNVTAPAFPYLRELRSLTRETANLGIVEDGEVMMLTQLEGRDVTRAIAPTGGRAPVIASALGKAILATYDRIDVEAIVAKRRIRRHTRHTITGLGDLHRELREVATCGYAVDNEEYVSGLRCVAAPVRNRFGETVCAISVSGPAQRIPTARLPAIGRLVADAAAELGQAL